MTGSKEDEALNHLELEKTDLFPGVILMKDTPSLL